jgi:hypothetical protein
MNVVRKVTEVSFESANSTLRIRRVSANAVVLSISGSDIGEFGDGPFEELQQHLADGPIDLFIDARHTRGATTDVSSRWAQWLAKNRAGLSGIYMLTGSRFIQLTANFVRDFAALGDLMRIYTDAAAFDELLDARIAH